MLAREGTAHYSTQWWKSGDRELLRMFFFVQLCRREAAAKFWLLVVSLVMAMLKAWDFFATEVSEIQKLPPDCNEK